LLIKLALGENRYKARRWREATLHLSPLATHEDAAKYPAEVAQGLYHAALAEIRSLRPEKAPPLYARALELKPSYAPALQALAEIAMEKGGHRTPPTCSRQATAPRIRRSVCACSKRSATCRCRCSTTKRARTCYVAAAAAAQPLEQKHVPLLEKNVKLQNAARDHAGAARTNELMAAFGSSPGERAARYVQAARDFLQAGDQVRARAAAVRAADSDPYDVDAVDLASGLAIDLGDMDSASAMLTRLLTAKDDRFTEQETARRALLSYRLGAARAQRGDVRQAVPISARSRCAAR
jgi:tetratricopeptide (TPR) repeat protein